MKKIKYLSQPQDQPLPQFLGKLILDNLHQYSSGYFIGRRLPHGREYVDSLKQYRTPAGQPARIRTTTSVVTAVNTSQNKLHFCYNLDIDTISKIQQSEYPREIQQPISYIIIEDVAHLPLHQLNWLLETYPQANFEIYTSQSLYVDQQEIAHHLQVKNASKI